MLYSPVKIRVVARLRSLARVSARTIGMYVPKSPMAPFSSPHLDSKVRFCLSFVIRFEGKFWVCDGSW